MSNAKYHIGLAAAFEILLGTQLLSRFLSREIYIFFHVCQQIIAGTKLS